MGLPRPHPLAQQPRLDCPGRGDGTARPLQTCLCSLPVSLSWLQGMVLLCLRSSIQQGSLEMVWYLSRPLAHQGEAQRRNPSPMGAQPAALGCRAFLGYVLRTTQASTFGAGEGPRNGGHGGQAPTLLHPEGGGHFNPPKVPAQTGSPRLWWH